MLKLPNQIRIIGGSLRGRKISFPESESLRPTGDRIRETLFNWLAPVIRDAQCLDLFAGSGALGFEAISRGAQHVVMCDQSSIVVKQLKKNAEILGVNQIEIIHAEASECLSFLTKRYTQKHLGVECHNGVHPPPSPLAPLPPAGEGEVGSRSKLREIIRFDIIFLDPPFHQGLLEKIIPLLDQGQHLNPNALLYFEAEANLKELPLSEKWELLRSKKSGEVGYHLAQWRNV